MLAVICCAMPQLPARHATLQAMLRMVVHTEGELLGEVLQFPAFLSSQVAAMLSSQDLKIIVAALQLRYASHVP